MADSVRSITSISDRACTAEPATHDALARALSFKKSQDPSACPVGQIGTMCYQRSYAPPPYVDKPAGACKMASKPPSKATEGK